MLRCPVRPCATCPMRRVTLAPPAPTLSEAWFLADGIPALWSSRVPDNTLPARTRNGGGYMPVPDEELNSPGEAEAPPEEHSPRTFATRHTIFGFGDFRPNMLRWKSPELVLQALTECLRRS